MRKINKLTMNMLMDFIKLENNKKEFGKTYILLLKPLTFRPFSRKSWINDLLKPFSKRNFMKTPHFFICVYDNMLLNLYYIT